MVFLAFKVALRGLIQFNANKFSFVSRMKNVLFVIFFGTLAAETTTKMFFLLKENNAFRLKTYLNITDI